MSELNKDTATPYDKVYSMVAYYKSPTCGLYTEKDWHDEEFDDSDEEVRDHTYPNLAILLAAKDNFLIKDEYLVPVEYDDTKIEYVKLRKLSNEEKSTLLNSIEEKDKEELDKLKIKRQDRIDWCAKHHPQGNTNGYIEEYPNETIFLYEEKGGLPEHRIYFYATWLGDDAGSYDYFNGDGELYQALEEYGDVMIALEPLTSKDRTNRYHSSILGYESIAMSEESDKFKELLSIIDKEKNYSGVSLDDLTGKALVYLDFNSIVGHKDCNSFKVYSNKEVVVIINRDNLEIADNDSTMPKKDILNLFMDDEDEDNTCKDCGSELEQGHCEECHHEQWRKDNNPDEDDNDPNEPFYENEGK